TKYVNRKNEFYINKINGFLKRRILAKNVN
ncbi:unnamed protein product, partial [marine sediment metagenome]